MGAVKVQNVVSPPKVSLFLNLGRTHTPFHFLAAHPQLHPLLPEICGKDFGLGPLGENLLPATQSQGEDNERQGEPSHEILLKITWLTIY
jgi:hypothetical protein